MGAEPQQSGSAPGSQAVLAHGSGRLSGSPFVRPALGVVGVCFSVAPRFSKRSRRGTARTREGPYVPSGQVSGSVTRANTVPMWQLQRLVLVSPKDW